MEHERLELKRLMFTICNKFSLHLEMQRFTSNKEWSYLSEGDFDSISFEIVGEKNRTGWPIKGLWQCNSNGSLYKCSVEELCLKHETEKEDWEGLHVEGKIFNSLLGLLFWKIIYMEDIPDVFRNPYQKLPYDWDTGK